jgi:serine-type D-Ala-D-Ala carboxypeptidase (penicillin-binding protein 5/6)
VSVVLGSTSMKARENASAALLNYGFTFYDTKLGRSRAAPNSPRPRFGRRRRRSTSGSSDDLYVTVPRGDGGRHQDRRSMSQPRLIRAARVNDAIVGQLRVVAGGETVATVPVHPLVSVAAGGWWRRLIDTMRLWFAELSADHAAADLLS